MCRGLARVAPEVLGAIDQGLLLAITQRLSRHPVEAVGVLSAWSGAPHELVVSALRSPQEIGAWWRTQLLRTHPRSMEPADLTILTSSDASPGVSAPEVERLLALFVAAPTAAELEEATRRVATGPKARADVRIAAAWRGRREGWQPTSKTGRDEPEVLRLFRESVCYRRAEEFQDPLDWRTDGLTHPAQPPATLPTS